MAAQTGDKAWQATAAPLAKALAENEQTVVAELAAVQGKPVDIGGYYLGDAAKCEAVMRPSKTLNAVLAASDLFGADGGCLDPATGVADYDGLSDQGLGSAFRPRV